MSSEFNAGRLFLASCVALIVTSMSFAIRGDIANALGIEFVLNNEQIGQINGVAFGAFALAMVFGGPLCDVVGMGRLAGLAFVGHITGIFVTIFAGGFWSLWTGTLLIGLGNGLVEAACNPLIATLYPDEKTKKLNQFHVWFPGGLVIGGLLAYGLQQAGMPWQYKVATMILPALIYGFLFLGQKFPQTERVQSGVSTGEMFLELLNPLFLFIMCCMFLTATTELAVNQWIPKFLTNAGVPGILVLVWVNTLMAVGRQAVGPLVHRVSPPQILLGSAVVSALGLLWLSGATGWTTFAAATVFAAGICYFWPTMLGFVAEYLPRSGALGLAVMGGAGNLAVQFALPAMGAFYDSQVAAQLPAGADVAALQAAAAGTAEAAQWAAADLAGGQLTMRYTVVLPVVLIVAFTILNLWVRGRKPAHEQASAAAAAD